MQLLGSKFLISRDALLRNFASLFILLLCLFGGGVADDACAIGKWSQGQVTYPPWQESFTYILINKNGHDIKYVIMKDAKIVRDYKKDGSQYQEPISLASIKKGSFLLFMAEGNRIYYLEQIDR